MTIALRHFAPKKASRYIWELLRVIAAMCLLALSGPCSAQAAAPKISISWDAQSLSHNIGRADKMAWSANPRQDKEGFLSYGPYYNGARGSGPEGHVAMWQMAIDNNTADTPSRCVSKWSMPTLAGKSSRRARFCAPNGKPPTGSSGFRCLFGGTRAASTIAWSFAHGGMEHPL